MIIDGITYDDVLLVPQFSDIKSRSQVDISVKLDDFIFNHPFIPANMKTVSGREMVFANCNNGGLSILNRFISIDEQLKITKDIITYGYASQFAISIGIQKEDRDNLYKFVEAGIKIVCIDIAHGDSSGCIDMTKWIRETFPNLFIIAGNIATSNAARRLWGAGANTVKVGVGSGSLCTTRIETGNGMPQLTALMDVAKVREKNQYIIADGGIKQTGDIIKALCFADMVMIGNMLAGCDESPGNIININGKTYKEYVGSSTHKTNHIEGVAAMVPYKGSYMNVITKITEGLQSGCSYQGAHNLEELKDNPMFVRITNAGLIESHPHDVLLK